MKKLVCFFLLFLSFSILTGASLMDYVTPEELPKTMEEACFEIVIPPKPGPSNFGVFLFRSFNWKGVDWKNHLLIIKPANLRSKNALIFITGSYKLDTKLLPLFTMIAVQNGAYVAVLFDIPNQPLFDGYYKEDWLIAYTFSRFLETGDYEWPILLPMVRSTITAMNVISDYAKKNGHEIEGFILSGASKRGWTTWLTAACDRRVKAIAPIAFDNLNMKKQMEHQIEFWGDYSKSISEYVETGILNDLNDEKRVDLLRYVDPYSYRENLSIPKLIIVGTNDSYWPVDAATLYFNGLPGEKGMVYAPNAGHSAEIPRTVQAIGALFMNLEEGIPLPKVMAEYAAAESETGLQVKVSIEANDWEISEIRLFSAYSSLRDFRKARFDYQILEKANETTGKLIIRDYTASYVEVVFERKGRMLSISTPAKVFSQRN